MARLIFVIAVILGSLLSVVLTNPQVYDTVEITTTSFGKIYIGELCECIGVKDENKKLCYGLMYACKAVK